ncbi:hypothetical protein VT84_08525 [Gemmata sp. SH-PL17]|uniref:DUF3616 domain-containing protein n=1 Tax=Gemmata sp. SH-PL17 TaxID=1630693 RepID=UPI00078C7C40|nr:DUF3616 domain-containing protein [Gemmata sp. SH-PL17]AMV24428.1 hypothetical protein VT84_08525 [Gemmata sp. SH-PL17]
MPTQPLPVPREYTGMCDASASAVLDDDHFVVADDEDNILRVYRLDAPGGAVAEFDWSAHLGIGATDAHPEADIEAAARVGDRVYWITSHGTNKDGKPRPNRRRFFATDVAVASGRIKLAPVGTPFRGLIEALASDPQLAEFEFAERARKAPESPGGLNIEGLTATPDGRLLIGFRNPVPNGTALLVPLENPDAVLADGRAPRFGAPVRLDLGARGVRSIDFAPAHEAYFIVAGPVGDGGTSALYRWSGPTGAAPVLLTQVNFAGLNPEAAVAPPGPRTDLLLLSDDGGRIVDGVACKQAARTTRRFRSLWVTP